MLECSYISAIFFTLFLLLLLRLLSEKEEVKTLPISPEEFWKLNDKSRHDYLRDATFEKMKKEGFIKIEMEKEIGPNRERRLDLYAEKEGKRVGVEIWTDRNLYEKIQDYEKLLDEVILVVPGRKVRLWRMEVPSKYLR